MGFSASRDLVNDDEERWRSDRGLERLMEVFVKLVLLDECCLSFTLMDVESL